MKSCVYIQSALYLAPDEVRTCCQRFFVRGKIKGDVSLNIRHENGELTYDDVVAAKQKLVEDINNGTDDRCDGCPYLVDDDWKPIEDEAINYLSIEHHSVCNMKCTYCSETYYGGLKPQFDLVEFAKSFEKVSPDLHIAWGGGEPTALKNFEETFSFVQDRFQPKTQRVFTNALKYSPAIQKALDDRRISITTSIDAGNPATFKYVRKSAGFKKVLDHLKLYSEHSPENVTIKYIFTEDNFAKSEIDGFLHEIDARDLHRCSFLLSTDYKAEKKVFDYLDNIVYLYFMLTERGAGSISMDDHIFNRLRGKGFKLWDKQDPANDDVAHMREKVKIVLERFSGSDVILWGTGEFAKKLLGNPGFRRNFNVIKIVDPDERRVGTEFQGMKVLPVSTVQRESTNIVIGSVNFFGEIVNRLKHMQVEQTRVVPSFLVY